MRRPRNNLARSPFEVREEACRLLFEGAEYRRIVEALKARWPDLAVRESSVMAYCKGAEYRAYAEGRRQWDERTRANRLAASALNEGRGPQSEADVAEYELLQALARQVGTVETPGDAAKLAAALSALKRAQASRARADADRRLEEAERAFREALAAKDAETARLKAEVEALRNPQPEDAMGLSDAEKTARIRERLGMV